MKDLALDPFSTTFLKTGNKFNFNNADDGSYLAQKIRVRVSIFLGEWYLNKNIGIPYFQAAESKLTNSSDIETALKLKIASTDGVSTLDYFTADYDGVGRILSINFRVTSTTGTTVEGTV